MLSHLACCSCHLTAVGGALSPAALCNVARFSGSNDTANLQLAEPIPQLALLLQGSMTEWGRSGLKLVVGVMGVIMHVWGARDQALHWGT